MGFWIYMLVMDLLIPATMLGFGWLFLHKAPKSINMLYGYRTVRSTKNQDTWEFAHKYIGRLWFQWGRVLLLVTVIVMLLLLGRDQDTIGTAGGILCIVQLIPLMYTIVPTERALKQHFDEKGNRK